MSKPSIRRCIVNRSGDTYMTKQGYPYFSGISLQTAGAKGICMHLLHLPPGGVEKAHLHRDHETAIYQISGSSELLYGDQLEHYDIMHAGDFIYIPPNTPHYPRNASTKEEGIVVIARSDPNEQESVELLPELEKLVPEWSQARDE